MILLVVSVLVVLTSVAVVWSIMEIRKAEAKDSYVDHFTDITLRLLDDPAFNPAFKKFLVEIAPHIQDRRAADAVAVDKAVARAIAPEELEVLRLLETEELGASDEKSRFVVAMYYYLMALSYSSPWYGDKLRRRLRGELADSAAMLKEGARAYRARHDDDTSFMKTAPT